MKALLFFSIATLIVAFLATFWFRIRQSYLITVILPCYQVNPSWLNQTLSSLEGQSIKRYLEILLIDDGSNPPLHTIVPDSYKILRHYKNMGLAAARNTGAVIASAPLIVFLDPDDWIDPTTLEKLMLLLCTAKESIAFAYPLVRHFRDGQVIFTSPAMSFSSRRLLAENFIPSFALMKRSLYLATGGMCEKTKGFEDYDYWLRLSALGYKGVLLNDLTAMLHYRRHSSGRTVHIEATGKEAWFSELQRNNPGAFGHLLPSDDSDLSKKMISFNLPCYRPLTGSRPLALMRAKFGLPRTLHHNPSILTEKIKLSPIPSFEQKRISVLFIIPWLHKGGADHYDVEILKVLRASNRYRVTLIVDVVHRLTTNQDHSLHASLVDEIFFLDRLIGTEEDYVVPRLLDYLMKSRAPRIVYIRNSHNGYRLAHRWRKRRDINWIDAMHLNTDARGWIYTTRPVHAVFHHRIVISKTLGNELLGAVIRKYPLARRNTLRIIPPFVDSSIWQSTETKCLQPSITLLFVGRFEDEKNPLRWLEIAKHLAVERDDMLFLMIGEGYLENDIKNNVAEQLKDRIMIINQFMPPKDLARTMAMGLEKRPNLKIRSCRGSSILLLTSKAEGVPMVMLEAVSIGIPVIAPAVGAIKETAKEIGSMITVLKNLTAICVSSAIDDVLGQREQSLPKKYRQRYFQISMERLFRQSSATQIDNRVN